MTRLVNQPTAMPVRKIKYAAIWGLVTAIVMAVVEAFAPRMSGVTGDLLAALSGVVEPFIPVIVATVVGYQTRERDDPRTPTT